MCDICEIEHPDNELHPVSLDVGIVYMCDWCYTQYNVNLIVKCNGCGFFNFVERVRHNRDILAKIYDMPATRFEEDNIVCYVTTCHKCGPKKKHAASPVAKLRFIKNH